MRARRLRRLRATLLPLVGLVGAGAGIACSGAAAGAAGATRARPSESVSDDHGLRGPLLWEVQGEAGASYLFGTIHAGFQADQELPDWVWEKLGGCDTFVMEADLGEVDAAELTRMAELPEGESLAAMMAPEDWRTLVDLTGLPESALGRHQPWFAVSLVLQRLYPTSIPLDMALLRRAGELGKEIAFLEDIRRQVEILRRTTTVEDLRELVRTDGKGRRLTDALLAAYRAGDLEQVDGVVQEELAENPSGYELLYAARNRDWVAKLKNHLRRGGAFVAVGAGHFPGSEGLIELLRSEGYVLSRVVAP